MEHSLFFDSVPEILQPWFSAGRPLWELLGEINEIIFDIVNRNPDAYNEIQKNVFAAGRNFIAPNVTISGPALIGSCCEIRPGAFLRESVIIGDNCVIGNSTEVKNAILFNHVEIPHFNYAGDSILGNYAHLGAGAILSNVRLDKQAIGVKYRGERIVTNRMKFGAIVGDRVEIGCNSVINPGSLLEKNVKVYPLVNTGGHHEAGSCVRK
jgi:NDP-sugar pyrophosphorylase family protein